MPSSVTAIIPYFNGHNTVGRALDSVYAQTRPVDAVIIIDDASSAESHAALQALIKTQDPSPTGPAPTIQIIRFDENQGPASARNAGWDAAQTSHIAFLDCDDAWHPEKIARQLKIMEENHWPFCAHRYAPDRDMRADMPGVTLYKLRDFLWRNRCSTPTVMVKQDMPQRFDPGRRYSEDYQLWLRLVYQQPFPVIAAEWARGFKASWGEAGLSSQSDHMFAGQQETYRLTAREFPRIKTFLPVLLIWSRIRHWRRKLILALRSRKIGPLR